MNSVRLEQSYSNLVQIEGFKRDSADSDFVTLTGDPTTCEEMAKYIMSKYFIIFFVAKL